MYQLKIVILFALICLTTASCSSVKQVLVPKIEERAKLEIVDPEPLVLNDVVWQLVTPENINEALTQSGGTLFTLSQPNYENLSLNLESITSRMLVIQSILDQYRSYYEGKVVQPIPE